MVQDLRVSVPIQKRHSQEPGPSSQADCPQACPLVPSAHSHGFPSHITVDLSSQTFIKALHVPGHSHVPDTVLSPHDRGGCYYYSALLQTGNRQG